MNAEYKQKWLTALRSGKYPQGREKLREDGKYCCLGVLCDIVDPDGWDGDKHRGTGGLLSEVAERVTGVKTFEMGHLINQNDTLGWDFNQIANYIENTL